MNTKILAPALLAGVLAACGTPQIHAVQDHIVTATKPDRLLVIDPGTERVVSEYHIPDAYNYVSNIVPSPDGKIAYVLVNGAQSIAGIDLRTALMKATALAAMPSTEVGTSPELLEMPALSNRTTSRSLANPSVTSGSQWSMVPVKCMLKTRGTPPGLPKRR
jgi:hypothetical protein